MSSPINETRTLPQAARSTSGVPAGRQIGPYRLVRELGHGGMGVVWLAERVDGQLKRPVALKLPLASLFVEPFLQRFSLERDIVAQLAHPNIARLYDAGVADGQPFLVLEYIEGASLSDYCNRQCLSVRDRLELFLQVLNAVQYAHNHLIVHRDLKPSNILVTLDGQAKLLDFGTAKLLSAGAHANSDLTQAGANALTPNYASPEQLQDQPVTTVSDIYSLGVVLFELLTGERPFRAKPGTVRPDERLNANSTQFRPSHAVLSDEAAKQRATSPVKLAKTLRGDLDTIVTKAMRWNAAERYATADAFTQDIRRYLAGHAVLARPESKRYRVRKFVLRHRWSTAATLAATVALVLLTVVSVWQWRVARLEALRSHASEQFLKDIFNANSMEQTDPLKARQTTARELLDIGAKKIDGELNAAPAAKLEILDTLEDLYKEMGLSDEAASLGRKSVKLASSLYGDRDPSVAEALIHLAESLHASRSVNEREAVLARAGQILDSNRDHNSQVRALLDKTLSEQYQSTDNKLSLHYAIEAVSIYRRFPPSDDLTEALFEQAIAQQSSTQYREAASALEEAIRISKQLDGDPNTALPRYYAYQGEVQQQLMHFADAERSLRAASSAAYRLKGDSHVDTIETELRLGQFLYYTARPADGLAHIKIARDVVLRVMGRDDPFYTPKVELEYGWALAGVGKLEEGLTHIEAAVENRRRNRPGTRYLAQMLADESSVFADLGQWEKARAAFTEIAAIKKKVDDPPDWASTEAQAQTERAAGHPENAARLFDLYVQAHPFQEPASANSLRTLQARAEAALDRCDAASALQSANLILQKTDGPNIRFYLSAARARAELAAGRALLLLHRPADALSRLTNSFTILKTLVDAASPLLGDVEVAMAQCEAALAHRDRAQTLLLSARTRFAQHPHLGEQHATAAIRVDNGAAL